SFQRNRWRSAPCGRPRPAEDGRRGACCAGPPGAAFSLANRVAACSGRKKLTVAVKVGINGSGRIGRITFRAMAARPNDFQIVGINDLGDPKLLANLLKYDSVQGRFPGKVALDGNTLVVNDQKIRIVA